MADLAKFRNQYPQYNDLADDALADALHQKYYSDLPKETVYGKLGVPLQKAVVAPAPTEPIETQPSMDGSLEQPARMTLSRGGQPKVVNPVEYPTVTSTGVMALEPQNPPAPAPASLIEARGAPVTAETFQAEAQRQAGGTPEQAAAAREQPGYAGSVAKSATRVLEQGARTDFRRKELVHAGAAPQTAENIVGTESTFGVKPVAPTFADQQPGTEYMPAPTEEDAARKEWWSKRSSGVRGITKGVLNIAAQSQGLADAAYEAMGAPSPSAKQNYGALKSFQDSIIGATAADGGRHLEGILESTITQVPWLALGIARGAATIPLLAMGLGQFGDTYSEARAAGVDVNTARLKGGVFAAAEVLGELASVGFLTRGFRKMLDGIPPEQLKARSIEFLTGLLEREIPGELGTTTAEFIADKWGPGALHPGWTAKDYAQQIVDTIIQTAGQVALMGAAGSAAGGFLGKRSPGDQLGRALFEDVSAAKPAPGAAEAEAIRRLTLDPARAAAARATVDRLEAQAALAGGPAVGRPNGPVAGTQAHLKDVVESPLPFDEQKTADAKAALAKAKSEEAAAEEKRLQMEADVEAAFAQEEADAAATVNLPTITAAGAAADKGQLFRTRNPLENPDVNKFDPSYDAEGTLIGWKPKETPRDGTPAAPIIASTSKDVAAAAAVTNPEPTPAQIEAENFAKGRFQFADPLKAKLGVIAIETKKGGTRTAKDGSWSVPNFPAHYGHLPTAMGNDGDKADVFIGDAIDSPVAFVIDQVNLPSRDYDETKSFVGFPTKEAAIDAYASGFSDGKGLERIGAITEMPIAQFVNRARADNLKNAVAYVKPKGAPNAATTRQEQGSAGQELPRVPPRQDVRKDGGEIRGEEGAGPDAGGGVIAGGQAATGERPVNEAGAPGASKPTAEEGAGGQGAGNLPVPREAEGLPAKTLTPADERRLKALREDERKLMQGMPVAEDMAMNDRGASLRKLEAMIEENRRLQRELTSPKGARPATGGEAIGKNADGQDIFQDARGVRSIVQDGVRISQTVNLVPTRAPNGGVEYKAIPTGEDALFVIAEPKKKQGKPSFKIDGDMVPPEVREPVEFTVQPLRPGAAPETKTIPAPLTAEQQADADIAAALGELGDLLGKSARLNITPEQEQKLFPILTKLFDAAFRKGYIKFKQAARFVRDTISKALGQDVADQLTLDHYQGAYISMAGRYRDKGAENAAAVAAVQSLEEQADELQAGTGGPKQQQEPAAAPGAAKGGEAGPIPEPGGEGVEGAGGPAVPADTGAGQGEGVKPAAKGKPRPKRGEGTGTAGAERPSLNYRITAEDKIGQSGWRQKALDNLAAVKIVKAIEKDNRPATPEEKKKLVKWVGWGASELANGMFPRMEYSYTTRKSEEVYKDGWEDLAKQLRSLLTDDEYEAARESTQNAHYTSPAIIQGIYSGLKHIGFRGGRMLEPGSGPGHFIGLQPEDLAGKINFTGVELDPITAKVAKALYPESRIENVDFTEFKRPDGFFDGTVGNPPFASTIITADEKYAKFKFSLHDYFVAKAVDLTAPGGPIVLITSRYTMDKMDDKARAYLMTKADLIGAIRLPQTAFKQNAGTEVVTDVLFFRKRKDGELASGPAWRELKEVKTKEGMVKINEYYSDHPEMVLGKHALTGTQYRSGEYTVEPSGNIEEQFAKAVLNLPADIIAPPAKVEAGEPDIAPDELTENSFYYTASKVLQKRNGIGVDAGLSAIEKNKVRSLILIRQAVLQTIKAQLDGQDATEHRKTLNAVYDQFVKTYGQINKEVVTTRRITKGKYAGQESVSVRTPNFDAFKSDPHAYRVASIEAYDPETGKATKREIFTQDVINPYVEPKIENSVDALHVTVHQLGKVDIEAVAEAAGVPVPVAIDTLADAIYMNPETKDWELAETYLAGAVRKKLKFAQAASMEDPSLARNVRALEAVQPDDLPAARIHLSLGSPLIDTAYVQQFASEALGLERVRVEHIKKAALWLVTAPDNVAESERAISDWGIPDRNAVELLSDALNSKGVRIYQTVVEKGTRKQVYDPVATQAALEKLSKIKAAFESWWKEDDDRATAIARIYNDTNNDFVKPDYAGPHIDKLEFPGIATTKAPYKHQKRAAWRVVSAGNTYLAHSVGSGKTLASILAGAMLKRLGLKKKIMYVVHNATLRQFASEWLEAYPAAKILVADDENFSKEERNRFMGRIAAENWDAIIITQSAFKMIPVSPEQTEKFITGELDEMRLALAAAEGDRGRTKAIERVIKSLEQKLVKMMSQQGKDKGVTFEESGVDQLFVDEAHAFRKLDFGTNQINVKGINPVGSQQAVDLFVKVRYLESKSPGRSTVLMSGTPLTNTIGEIFNIQRVLQLPELEARGMHKFDAWSSSFGSMVTELEAQPSGAYKNVTRFGRFKNMRDLSRMWSAVGDVVHTRDLPYLNLPKVKGGGRQVVLGESTQVLKDYKKALDARIKDIEARKRPPKKGDDIILSVITDGRHAALDERYIDRNIAPNPESKLEKAIANVAQIYKDTESVKGTQMVFADLGMPGSEALRGFSVYNRMRQGLIEKGIPADQIVFAQDFKTPDEKRRIFAKMNAGEVRVMIGSSDAMGTGVNAQQRIVWMHHLDADKYLPSNIEQREGRGIRQGNELGVIDGVGISVYITKGSYDEKMWQFIESKQRAIDQFLAGDLADDSMDDIDGAANQFAELKAMSSDNPLAMEKAGLDAEVSKLENLYWAHRGDQSRHKATIAEVKEDQPKVEKLIEELKAAVETTPDLSADKFVIDVGDKSFTSREEAGKAIFAKMREIGDALMAKIKAASEADREKTVWAKTVAIGSIGGQKLSLRTDLSIRGEWTPGGYVKRPDVEMRILRADPVEYLYMDRTYVGYVPPLESIYLSEMQAASESGLVTRIVNNRTAYAQRLKQSEEFLAKLVNRGKQAEERIGAPFIHEAALTEKRKRLEEVERELMAEEQTETSAAAEQSVEDDVEPKRVSSRFAAIDTGEEGEVSAEPAAARDIDLDEAESAADPLELADGLPTDWIRVGDTVEFRRPLDRLLKTRPATGQGVVASIDESEDGDTYITTEDGEAVRMADATLLPVDEDTRNENLDRLDRAKEAAGDKFAVGESAFSDRYLENQDAIAEGVIELAKQIAPQVNTEVVEQLFGKEGERTIEIAGLHRARAQLIRVALRYRDPQFVMRHEAVHSFFAMGLLSGAEQRVLKARAGDWRKRFNIEDRYPYLVGNEEALDEEGMGDAYGAYGRGEKFGGFIGSAFAKISLFLQRLGNLLRGLGFQSAKDVFARMESGEVGRREQAEATLPMMLRRQAYSIPEEPPAEKEPITTRVHGVEDVVLDRERMTPERTQGSIEHAKRIFDEVGLDVVPRGDGLWDVADKGAEQDEAGYRLLEALRREVRNQNAGPESPEIASLLTSVAEYVAAGDNTGMSAPLRIKLYGVAQGERSHRGLLLGALAQVSPDSLNRLARNIEGALERVYAEQFGGSGWGPGRDGGTGAIEGTQGVLDDILRRFREQFTDEDLAKIAEASPELLRLIDRLAAQPALRDIGGRLYRKVQRLFKEKEAKTFEALAEDARVNEAAQKIIEDLKQFGIEPKEQPGKKALTAIERLMLMVNPETSEAIDTRIAQAIVEAERNAGIAATMADASPDERDLMREAFRKGLEPSPEMVEQGMQADDFRHWRVLRDNLLGYSPTTLKLVQQVVQGTFKGTKFGQTPPKPVDVRIDMNKLARSPAKEVQRVLDAAMTGIEAEMLLAEATPETLLRVSAMIQGQVTAQLEAARARVRDRAFAPPATAGATLTPDQRLRELFNAGLLKDPRLDNAVAAIAKKSAVRRLMPNLPEMVKKVFATRFYRQGELENRFGRQLSFTFGLSEPERKNAEKLFAAAFAEQFTKAKAKALETVHKSLTPKQQTTVRKVRKLWETIERAVNAGAFDSAFIMQELALARGWTVPTDAQLAEIRTLANREQELRELTNGERATAERSGEVAEAEEEKAAATLSERARLKREMQALWLRWTAPMGWRTAEGRRNVARAVNEVTSANLLLRPGFFARQLIDVATQTAVYTPTRAAGEAIMRYRGDKTIAGRQTRLWRDVGQALHDAYAQRTKALRAALAATRRGLAGRSETKNVEQILDNISIFDRAELKADELAAEGKTAQAFLMRVANYFSFAFRYAKALDELQGTLAEAQEMQARVITELRERGATPEEAQARAAWVMGDTSAEFQLALARTQQMFDAAGLKSTPAKLEQSAWDVVKARQYGRIAALKLDAEDFKGQNRVLRNVIGWNEREMGGFGGVIAGFGRSITTLAEQIGLPMPLARFSNAIGISINRALTFTPLGFFSQAFKDSPWYEGERNATQRKIEAAAGTSVGLMMLMLVAAGVLVPRFKWPEDEAEREIWRKLGRQPGTVEIMIGGGKYITVSLTVGPLSLVRPYLVFMGSIMESLAKHEKKAEKLARKAEEAGLQPAMAEKKQLDILYAAALAGYSTFLGGRTAVGIISNLTDYRAPQPGRTAAGLVSPLIPGAPQWQELSRMQGVQLDANRASVLDFMFPTGGTAAEKRNFFYDPLNDQTTERIVKVLTGGTWPLATLPIHKDTEKAYRVLYETGWRPPGVQNQAREIGDQYRAFDQDEMEKYRELRGRYLKKGVADANLDGLTENEKLEELDAVAQEANQDALDDVIDMIEQKTGGAGASPKVPVLKLRTAPREIRP